MHFSVVITTFNEDDAILPLLASLVAQTERPQEIIVVDAGSHDGTIEKIERFVEEKPDAAVKLLVKPGVNRSEGRNIGVERATSDWIAVTDAGCIAEKNWLFNLKRCAQEKQAEAVAGFYIAEASTSIQKVAGLFLAIQPERFDAATFLPSSRSIAFSKEAFEKVDGYPEELNTCEDLVFARQLKECVAMRVCREALVRWVPPSSLNAFFSAVSGYAMGDILGRYWPHTRKIITVFWRYVLFIWVPWLFVPYLAYPLVKFRKHLSTIDLYLYVPVMQVVSDFAVMWGALRGLWARRR